MKPEEVRIVEITLGDNTVEYRLEYLESTGVGQWDSLRWKMGIARYPTFEDAKKAKNNLTKDAIISRKVVG